MARNAPNDDDDDETLKKKEKNEFILRVNVIANLGGLVI
jgi:hypothetical protein